MCNAVVLAEMPHGIHLILHQGNQRGDYDCRSLHHQCRQLVAHAFSASCGHDHKGVATVQQITDNCLLVAFEAVKTEVSFQRLAEIWGRGHEWG